MHAAAIIGRVSIPVPTDIGTSSGR